MLPQIKIILNTKTDTIDQNVTFINQALFGTIEINKTLTNDDKEMDADAIEDMIVSGMLPEKLNFIIEYQDTDGGKWKELKTVQLDTANVLTNSMTTPVEVPILRTDSAGNTYYLKYRIQEVNAEDDENVYSYTTTYSYYYGEGSNDTNLIELTRKVTNASGETVDTIPSDDILESYYNKTDSGAGTIIYTKLSEADMEAKGLDPDKVSGYPANLYESFYYTNFAGKETLYTGEVKKSNDKYYYSSSPALTEKYGPVKYDDGTNTGVSFDATGDASGYNGNEKLKYQQRMVVDVTNKLEETQIQVVKRWDDNSNLDSSRPSYYKITVTDKETHKEVGKSIKNTIRDSQSTDYISIPTPSQEQIDEAGSIEAYISSRYEITESAVWFVSETVDVLHERQEKLAQYNVVYTDKDGKTQTAKSTDTLSNVQFTKEETDSGTVYKAEIQNTLENYTPEKTTIKVSKEYNVNSIFEDLVKPDSIEFELYYRLSDTDSWKSASELKDTVNTEAYGRKTNLPEKDNATQETTQTVTSSGDQSVTWDVYKNFWPTATNKGSGEIQYAVREIVKDGDTITYESAFQPITVSDASSTLVNANAYAYSDYNYVGKISLEDSTVDIVYYASDYEDDPTEYQKDVAADLEHYLNAIYTQNLTDSGTPAVTKITYNSVNYTWDEQKEGWYHSNQSLSENISKSSESSTALILLKTSGAKTEKENITLNIEQADYKYNGDVVVDNSNYTATYYTESATYSEDGVESDLNHYLTSIHDVYPDHDIKYDGATYTWNSSSKTYMYGDTTLSSVLKTKGNHYITVYDGENLLASKSITIIYQEDSSSIGDLFKTNSVTDYDKTTGYSTNVINTVETTSIILKKAWTDDKGNVLSLSRDDINELVTNNILPETITFTLYYKDSSNDVPFTYTENGEEKTYTLTANTVDSKKKKDLIEGIEWDELPSVINGRKAEYTVKETAVTYADGTVASGDALYAFDESEVVKDNEVTVKNNANLKELVVTKVWDDEGNRDNKRTDITITLKRDGEDYITVNTSDTEENYYYKVSKSASDTWTVSFKNLPVYQKGKNTKSTYTVEESGYDADYYTKDITYPDSTKATITNAHINTDKTSFTVTKKWNQNNLSVDPIEKGDREKPTSVTFTLQYLNGSTWTDITQATLNSKGNYADNGIHTTSEVTQTINVTDLKDITCVWNNLPRSLNGKMIQYRVVETGITGYTETTTPASVTADNTKANLEQTITNALTTESVTIEKKWDNSTRFTDLPEEVTFNIQRRLKGSSDDWAAFDAYKVVDGQRTDTKVVDNGVVKVKTSDGKIVISNLPKYATDNSTEYEYRVKEVGTNNWITTSESTMAVTDVDNSIYKVSATQKDKTFTFTNTLKDGNSKELTVDKVWDDNNNRDNKRTKNITVTLYRLANGTSKKLDSQKLNESSSWKYTWSNLPDYGYDADGKKVEYKYYVLEDSIPSDYIPVYSYSGEDNTLYHAKDKSVDSLISYLDNKPTITSFTYNNKNYEKEDGVWDAVAEDLGETLDSDVTYTLNDKNYTYSISNAGIGLEDNNKATVTNIYAPETFEVTGIKNWGDEEETESYRPYVLVTLQYKIGSSGTWTDIEKQALEDRDPTDNSAVYTSSEPVQILSSANEWTTTWKDLPAKSRDTSSKTVYYQMTEELVEKLDGSITVSKNDGTYTAVVNEKTVTLTKVGDAYYYASDKKKSYYVKEESTSIFSNSRTKDYAIENALYSIQVVKVDKENASTQLAGAEFSLYKVDTTTKTKTLYAEKLTTGEDGTLTITSGKNNVYFEAGDTFKLVETKAPEGYEVNTTPITFRITDDNKYTIVDNITYAEITKNNETVIYDDESIKVGMEKDDEDGKQIDSDKYHEAEFKVTPVEGNHFADQTLDKITFTVTANKDDDISELDGMLVAGQKYKFTETKAPDGYAVCSFTVTVNEDGTLEIVKDKGDKEDKEDKETASVDVTDNKVLVKVKDEKLQAQVSKVDTNGDLITSSSATFKVTGNFVGGEREKTYTTSHTNADGTVTIDGNLYFKGELIGGESYTIEETTAPDGYELANKCTLKMNQDGTYFVYYNDNDKKYVDAMDYSAFEDKYSYVGSYTLTNGNIQAKYEDDATVTEKKADLIHYLEAYLATNGTIAAVYEGQTYNGDKLEDLVEIIQKAEDIVELIIGKATYTTITDYKQGVYEIKDEQITVSLTKSDINDGSWEESSDDLAEFKIAGKFAKTSEDTITGLTSANIYETLKGELIGGNIYTVTETKAPEGYEVVDPFEITVNQDGTLTLVKDESKKDTDPTEVSTYLDSMTVYDTKISLSLTKTTGDSTDSIEGSDYAIFKVTGQLKGETESKTYYVSNNGTTSGKSASYVDKDGNTVNIDKLYSFNYFDGQWLIKNEYTLEEVYAPNGYELNTTEVTFNFDQDGKVTLTQSADGPASVRTDTDQYKKEKDALTIKDDPIELDITKVSSKSTTPGLKGAEFKLYESTESTKYVTLTSNDSGNISLKRIVKDNNNSITLTYGKTYVLEETKAPDGYELPGILENGTNTEPLKITFTIDSDGTIKNGRYEMEKAAAVNITEATTNYVYEDADKDTLTVKNTPIVLNFDKVSSEELETKLSGYTFTVTGTFADNSTEQTINGDVKSLSALLIYGNTYTIKETKAPDGYELFKDVKFTVLSDGTIKLDTNEKTVYGTDVYTAAYDSTSEKVTLRDDAIKLKLDKYLIKGTTTDASSPSDTKEAATDRAEFTITGVFNDKAESQAVKDVTGATISSLDGKWIAGNIYKAEETYAPEGYEIISAFYFKVATDGTVTLTDQDGKEIKYTGYKDGIKISDETVEVHDPKVSFTFTKVSSKDSNNIDSASDYAIFEFKGKTKDGSDQTYYLGTKGSGKEVTYKDKDGTEKTVKVSSYTSLDGKLIAGETYTFKEVYAPAGYELDDTAVTFKFSKTGLITDLSGNSSVTAAKDALTIKDDPIELDITKVSSKSTTPGLKGAEFRLYESTESTKYVTLTSNDSGNISLKRIVEDNNNSITLTYGKTYVLEETKAPDGYELPGILENGTNTEPLKITFTIDSDGTIKNGRYEMEKAAAVNITEATTNYVYEDADKDTLTVKNTPIVLNFDKVSSEELETKLSGYTFTVTGTFADNSTEQTINGDVKSLSALLIYGNTYTIKETKAPDGYELFKDVTFTVLSDGTIKLDTNEKTVYGDVYTAAYDSSSETVTLRDDIIKVVIKKISDTDNQLITSTSATFDLYQSDGTTKVGEGLTTDNGTIEININKGVTLVGGETYILKETNVPTGFTGVEDIKFILGTNGEVTVDSNSTKYASVDSTNKETLSITNTAVADLVIKKYEADGTTPLANVTFEVQNLDGTTVKEGTTDSKGIVTFSDLPSGDYQLVETKSAANYNLLSEPIEFSINRTNGVEQSGTFTCTLLNKTNVTLSKYDSGDKAGYFYFTIDVTNKKTFDLPLTGNDYPNIGLMGISTIGATGLVYVGFKKKKSKKNRK